MAALTTASIIALGGMAVSAGTAGMSFAQAGKQKSLQRQAERDAQNAFDAAKKDLGKNYYQALGIQKEPYELSREGMLSTSFGLTQAAQESERGAAEAAGRIYLASQQGQGQIRSEMGQELSNLEKLTAQEDSRLRDIGVGLDLEQAAGYQQAAKDAQEAAAAATTQGMTSATNAITTGIKEIVPLFPNQGTAKTAIPATVTNPATTTTPMSKSIDQSTLKGGFNFNQPTLDINGNPINPQTPPSFVNSPLIPTPQQEELNPYLRNYKFNNFNPYQPY
jgi:hypothetical protein